MIERLFNLYFSLLVLRLVLMVLIKEPFYDKICPKESVLQSQWTIQATMCIAGHRQHTNCFKLDKLVNKN